jgi:hypothetical protein
VKDTNLTTAPKPKKKLPEQKSSHQTVVAPDLLSFTSLLCSLSSTTEPQLKFVRRWKKEEKVRKYPTTKKNKKIKKKRDCIIASFLYTKVTKNQAIEALIILATSACKALKKQTTTKRKHTQNPRKTKKEIKTLFFVSLFSPPRADKRQQSALGRTLGI